MLLMSNTMTLIIRLFGLEMCSREIPSGPTDLPPIMESIIDEISTEFI